MFISLISLYFMCHRFLQRPAIPGLCRQLADERAGSIGVAASSRGGIVELTIWREQKRFLIMLAVLSNLPAFAANSVKGAILPQVT